MHKSANTSPRTLGLALTLGLQILMARTTVDAQEQPAPVWSVSLISQGYHSSPWGGPNLTQVGGVAPTSETVGVLLGNHTKNGVKPVWQRPWEVYLLLYDAHSGRFLDKKGPWNSGYDFRLVPTSGGKFVVFLAAFEDQGHWQPASLLLLTSSGAEIKRVTFDFDRSPRPLIGFANSPSLRTILIYFASQTETQYRILDPETLETSQDWFDTISRQASVAGDMSDEQLLGNLDDPPIMEFRSNWKNLPEPPPVPSCGSCTMFRSNIPFFLENGVLVGKACETDNELIVPIQKANGSLVSLHSAKKLPDYNYLQRFSLASSDGKHFGLLLAHESKLGHWLNYSMDMGLTGISYFLYVWDVDTRLAICRIEMQSYLAAARFFPPPMQALAVVEGGHLRIFSLTP